MILMLLASDSQAADSFKGQLVAGVVTILVALIGLWAKKHFEDKHETSTDKEEPSLTVDLMKQRSALEREKRELRAAVLKKDAEIERLRTMLWVSGIHPDTGRKVSSHNE